MKTPRKEHSVMSLGHISGPWNCPLVLVGGNGYSSGNVFVDNRNGHFGPVCDDGWTNTAATVVCK